MIPDENKIVEGGVATGEISKIGGVLTPLSDRLFNLFKNLENKQNITKNDKKRLSDMEVRYPGRWENKGKHKIKFMRDYIEIDGLQIFRSRLKPMSADSVKGEDYYTLCDGELECQIYWKQDSAIMEARAQGKSLIDSKKWKSIVKIMPSDSESEKEKLSEDYYLHPSAQDGLSVGFADLFNLLGLQMSGCFCLDGNELIGYGRHAYSRSGSRGKTVLASNECGEITAIGNSYCLPVVVCKMNTM